MRPLASPFRMTAQELASSVERYPWYHTLELGDGVVTKGMFDHRPHLDHYPIPADLSGKRCLDVATMDGFWAFEMERRGAASVVALDLEDPEGVCVRLQQSVSDRLEANRFYKPEKRPFWPHVTLARVKRDALARPLEAAALPPAFSASELTLYRSTLRPQGALYEPLARTVAGDALDPASGPSADGR